MQAGRHLGPPPVLLTARLRLRAPLLSDWPAYAAFMASPRSRHMGGPFDTHRAWHDFCQDTALWSLTGAGGLMITDRETGTTLGQVAISQGPRFPETELGWLLYDGAEGRGFAGEAACALRDWAMGPGGCATLVSYIAPGNLRSAALARRMGATVDPDATPQDPGDLVFRHPRPA